MRVFSTTSLVYIFFGVLSIDLFLIPMLALFEYGMSVDVNSNYFVRFGYLAIFIWGCFFLLFRGRFPRLNYIQWCFLLAVPYGFFLGLVRGNPYDSFLSHFYFFTSPIIGIFVGRYVYDVLDSRIKLQRQCFLLLSAGFFFACFVVSVFVLLKSFNYARYDAIGLWGFLYGAAFAGKQISRSVIGLIFSVLASKITVIVSFFASIVLAGFRKRGLFLIFCSLIAGAGVLAVFTGYSGLRLFNKVQDLFRGDFEAASSGRFSELVSFIEYLDGMDLGFLIGAGYGGRFLPWPDQVGGDVFYEHFVHFGNLSWLLVVGAPFYFLVVILLSFYVFSWVFHYLRSRSLSDLDLSVGITCFAIFVVSFFGAVLTTNIICWVFFGMLIRLRRKANQNMLR